MHAVDNVSSLCSMEAETLCQVIESASKDGYHKVEVGFPTPQNSGNQCSGGGDVSTATKKLSCKTGSTSGHSERRGMVTPMTPADSGYIGCEDKLSPSVEINEARKMTSSRNASPVQMNLRPLISINTNAKDFNNDSGLKFNSKNIAASITNRKPVSLYDNMSPEKGFMPAKMSAQTKYACDKYKQLTLNNLNTLTGGYGPDVPAVTISDTTKMLRNPSLVLRNIQLPPDGRDQNVLAAIPKHQSYDVNTMIFPSSIMKNLKWIKLDETVVGENFSFFLAMEKAIKIQYVSEILLM